MLDIKESIEKENPLEHFSELTFGTFQIDLLNYLEIKHIMYQKLRLQPSEIEYMPYYELEYTLENLKKWLEREAEENKKQNEDTGTKYDQKSMMRESQSMMKNSGYNHSSSKSPGNYKMPKMPNF